MDYLHIRFTFPSFPTDLLVKFKNYVIVSHNQSTFHWHVVTQLRDITVKTFRNYMSSNYKGNAEYSMKQCDLRMVNYLFHPGSNWDNYQTDYLSDEAKLVAIADSEEYFNSLKTPEKKDIVDQIIQYAHEIRQDMLSRRMETFLKAQFEGNTDIDACTTSLYGNEVRDSYKRGLFRLIVKTKKLCPTSSNIKQYLQTCYIREGILTEEQFLDEIAIDGLGPRLGD